MAVQLGHLQYPSQSGMPALFTAPELIAPFKAMCLLIPCALAHVHTDPGVSLLVLKAQERLCGVLGHGSTECGFLEGGLGNATLSSKKVV